MLPFQGLDHVAIVVPNTEEALTIWRDRFGFPVVGSEVVNNGTVRLTHLDLGNTHLQLVEPLTPDHPLRVWLEEHGPGLHHICLRVENVDVVYELGPTSGLPPGQEHPHQAIRGKRALFLNQSCTDGVVVEVTGA